MVPSSTICCPVSGVISRSVPAVLLSVLPLRFRLSTCKAVKVPRDVTFACAAVVNVPARLVAVTTLSFKSTESMVTPAFSDSSPIVSVLTFLPTDTSMSYAPVVLPFASTSASVSDAPT